VIAAILADPEGHAGQTYDLSGPTDLTAPEIAGIVSHMLDKPVEYAQISGEQWIKNIRNADVGITFLAQHLNAIAPQQSDGEVAGTNDNIERITGRRAESVAEFINRNRGAWA
jgi:NAD(P)H dehydrogenase (quinone)